MKLVVAALATVATATAAGPAVAQTATLDADPDLRCYPEQERILLPGDGFTPNTRVDFSRDGSPLKLRGKRPIVSDAAGTLAPILTLPELLTGARTIKYLATDTANTANSAALSLLVTATHVGLRPKQGAPERPFRIRARGFFGGGKTLWAHILRRGEDRARQVRIGRIKGACKKVKAKKRLFTARAAPGVYRVQFDAFKRYRKRRKSRTRYEITIDPGFVPAAASAASVSTGFGLRSASARDAVGLKPRHRADGA